MAALIYLFSLLAPRPLRARWREEWLGELAAARRAGGAARTLRIALGAPFDALSSRWTTRSSPTPRGGGPWRTDLKQTLRGLRRSPGHVAVVVLCLGVGIAVCTTTFSILNAFNGGELPGVTDRMGIGRLHLNGGNASVADYEIMREGSPSFSSIAAEGVGAFAVRVEGRAPMNVDGAWVSGNYFEVLGTQAHLGRMLHPSDDRPGAPLAVTIAHAFWTARLGAPADIVGKSIVIGGRDAVVTGVAPQGFRGLRGGELNDGSGFGIYAALAHVRGWPGARLSEERWLNVYGRLTVPLDRQRLTAELLPLASRIEATKPARRPNPRIAVTESWLTPGATPAMMWALYLLMLSAPLTVLAIGCANVANLQLVRASLRIRELAVRASLGASRAQIIRLLTFEAVMLVIAAFATSAPGIWILLRVAALVIPIPVSLDTRVLLFTAGLAVLVIGATGVMPGLISTRADASAHLRTGGRSMASGNSRLRRGLVVAQVSLCFLLLLAAGVFARGLAVISGNVPPHAEHTLITRLRFDVQAKYGAAARRAFLDEFDGRMRADGRIRGIAYTAGGPSSHGILRAWRPGDPPEAGKVAESTIVEGDYFDVSGIRIRQGRALTKTDAAAATAAVVDQAFVDQFQLAEPVVGQSLRISLLGDSLMRQQDPTPRHVTIVGVAAAPVSAGATALEGGNPTIYLPMGPSPDDIAIWISVDNAALLAGDVRRTIADIDPELPALYVRTLEDIYQENSAPLVMIARTASGLGSVALLLAVSGLYSVIAFFVALRTNEFGIRLALGARSVDIVRMVLGQALRLTAVGLAVGGVLGVPLLMALHANFPFTQRFDPAVILPTALVLALTALFAGWVPARRASSIQAADALRSD
jgi:putative ABC transport system permease protein